MGTLVGLSGKYHKYSVPPNFLFSLGTIVSPKRNRKQCLYKIWGQAKSIMVFSVSVNGKIISENATLYLKHEGAVDAVDVR